MSRASEVGPNVGGKLVIRKPWPSMLRTIYGDKERYQKQYWSEFKGSYLTGDGARRDKDGYFWIVGRIDDVLNVAGHRLGTAEIESALVSHPKVAEAAVVGRPDEMKGQGVVAFVTLKGGVTATAELEGGTARITSASTSAPSPNRTKCVSPRRCRKRAAAKSCAVCSRRSPAARRHRRHDDAGRFQRSREAQRGRMTPAIFTSVENQRRPLRPYSLGFPVY